MGQDVHYFAKIIKILTSIWVKINCFPDYLMALALSVKASNKTFDPSLLNKQIPGLAWLNISPIVLSSNGTTVGL